MSVALTARAAIALALALTVVSPSASAQRAAAPVSATNAPAGPAFQIGVEERVRTENWTDIVDHDAGRSAKLDRVHQWRLRTRVWGRVPLSSRLDVSLGLNDESRLQTTPDVPLRLDEIVLEQLALEWRLGARDVLRLGRQNVMRDEGFILFDGTPLDGSRTAYANALSYTRAWGERMRLELLGLANPRRELYLPLLNDRSKALLEGHERIYGLYLTAAPRAGTDLRAYVLRKEEDTRAKPSQPPRDLQIIGGRVVRRVAGGWSFTGELAGEWGRQEPDVAVHAWGGLAGVRKTLAGAWKPTLGIGWIGLSGDDPGTAAIEGWDPPMSRWPKWSELYVYSQVPEQGIGTWTNLGMGQIELACAPSPRLALRATYYRLGAWHPFVPGAADTLTFGDGKTRGDLFEARCDFTVNASLKGHVVYERLWPGDFYQGREAGDFLRFELVGTWQKSFSHKGLFG